MINYSKSAIILVCFVLSIGEVFAQSVTESDAYSQAVDNYNKGQYQNARELVDRFYTKDNGKFAILSALLFIRENKCENALSAIKYLNGYYEAHMQIVSSSEYDKWIYKSIKKITIKCYLDESRWYELEKDLLAYKDYADDEADKDKVQAILAETYLSLAEAGIDDAIANYENVVDEFSDKTSNTGTYEAALYKLAGLHVYVDKKKQAINDAVELFKVSSNDSYWLNKMKASKWHKLLLDEPELKQFLKKINQK